jgi:hypothetical protein
MIAHWTTVLLTILLLVATAHAEKRDPVVAEQLFNEGRVALDQRNFIVACKKFAESHRLDPAAGTLMNHATCEQQRGRVATAWQLWREALERLDPNDDRVAFVRSQIRALEPRIPRLALRAGQLSPQMAVYRDGVRLGESSLNVPLRVDPGRHVVLVRARGHADRLYRIELSEREQRTLVLGIGRELPSRKEGTLSSESESGSGSGARTWGYVLSGVGLASLGGAIVTHALIEQKKDTVATHCPNKVCNERGYSAVQDGKTLLVANRILWGLGGTAFAGGVALLLFSPDATDERQVGLVLSPSAFGVVHRGRF